MHESVEAINTVGVRAKWKNRKTENRKIIRLTTNRSIRSPQWLLLTRETMSTDAMLEEDASLSALDANIKERGNIIISFRMYHIMINHIKTCYVRT